MSEMHGHETANAFSAAELDSLHKEDVHAGRAVVSLIFGILIIGVALYSVVLWAVAT